MMNIEEIRAKLDYLVDFTVEEILDIKKYHCYLLIHNQRQDKNYPDLYYVGILNLPMSTNDLYNKIGIHAIEKFMHPAYSYSFRERLNKIKLLTDLL